MDFSTSTSPLILVLASPLEGVVIPTLLSVSKTSTEALTPWKLDSVVPEILDVEIEHAVARFMRHRVFQEHGDGATNANIDTLLHTFQCTIE